MTAIIDKEKRNDDKKLTKVVSTKLSIESYRALQIITNTVYQNKGINKPTISEFLRFTIDLMIRELPNKAGFSVLGK
jgi:hypothetical protein